MVSNFLTCSDITEWLLPYRTRWRTCHGCGCRTCHWVCPAQSQSEWKVWLYLQPWPIDEGHPPSWRIKEERQVRNEHRFVPVKSRHDSSDSSLITRTHYDTHVHTPPDRTPTVPDSCSDFKAVSDVTWRTNWPQTRGWHTKLISTVYHETLMGFISDILIN